MLALRRRDVLVETGEISISASIKDDNELDPDKPRKLVRGSTKTAGSVRVIPIAPELREALFAYMDQHVPQDPDAPLFRAPRSGGYLAENSFTEVYVKAREQVPGLSGCRFHDLRHNLLTKVSAAAGVAVAKKIAGHSDVRTTGGYLDAVSADDLHTAMSGNHAAKSASADRSDTLSDSLVDRARTLSQLDPDVQAQVLRNLPEDMAAKIMAEMITQQ